LKCAGCCVSPFRKYQMDDGLVLLENRWPKNVGS
jgi:hypothetical protein